MSRPQLIRADTIDLQDHTSPSAKDHTRQPTHPGALGAGPPAPHQAETLREVAAEAEEEQHRSPRLSNDWPNGDNDNGQSSASASKHQQQDASAIAQNGGLTGAEDADMADAEGDDGMDDDMMDKISSSPSIDDGGYSIPSWPARFDSLSIMKDTPSAQAELARSSSPFVKTPDFYPLNFIDSTPQVNIAIEGTIKSGSSSYSQLVSQSSEQSTPTYKAGSSFSSEQRDVLHPLPGDLVDPFVDSFDDEFHDEPSFGSFVEPSEADYDQYFEPTYDDSSFMIPYECSDDDGDDIVYPEDTERFVDSGWGGECLRDLEDIDFEFVYALHTFVATVEGQANATKGDTMVLLDDSNSYWWLVRVVKDSSIGYLPAEHIETPTERLARLNKHRNIDLSASMLGDQGEKSKNPLKKAIRRRNAKTVTFSAPTYVEASDIDYSSDEEGDGDFYAQDAQQAAQQAETNQQAAVESTSERTEARDADASASEIAARKNGDSGAKASSESLRTSDEIFDANTEKSSKSRNGTVRNTDSFFKDDTVETRKITLTPNLLRDDSSTSTIRTSGDSKELRQRPSIDKLEKDTPEKGKEDKKKKDKKEKDKKPGMLSNLFSRKKKKLQDDDIDELIYGKKTSGEDARASPAPSNDSEEFVAEEATQRQSSPQRQPSKLQKRPQMDGAIAATTKLSNLTSETRPVETQQAVATDRAPTVEPSMRIVRADSQEPSDDLQRSRMITPEVTRAPITLNTQDVQKSENPLTKILRARSHSNTEPKPEKVKKAKVRSELDDFDSSVESSPIEAPAQEPIMEPVRETPVRPSIPGAYPDSYVSSPVAERSNPIDERLSESPVQVSPVEPASRSNPPALMVDTSSQEDGHSPVSSPSPDIVDADEARGKKTSEHSMSTPTSTSTWNDAHLRTFFDDDSEIKDLLVVVYDKSGVVPAGPDHPITGNLFKEENAKLADITTRLDGMLGDWLARKSKVSAR